MQQQKVTRGLAASAVAALAITGLTAAPAHADPDADLLSVFNAAGNASTRGTPADPFGYDQTITLTAEVDETDLEAAYFEYNADETAGPATGGWTSIPGGTISQGFVTANWNPDPSLAGTSVSVRVVANDTGLPAQYDIRNNVAISGGDSVHAVRLSGSQGGYFDQPYAGSGRTSTYLSVSGWTSATSGTVEISAWRSAAGEFQGQTDAVVRETTHKLSPGVFAPAYRFQGAVDISAYDADPDEVIAVAAERDSDDVVPATLYAQTVAAVYADFRPNVPTTRSTPTTVNVTDQFGRPIAGAEVRRLSDGAVVGYTGGEGTVTTNQPSGTTEQYFVNTTDADAYEAGTDVIATPAEAPPYVPVPWTVDATLADGAAFDDDEYAVGDIVLRVRDQLGDPYAAGAEVLYRLYPTGGAVPAATAGTTDADGRIVVPFDPAGLDGSWTLSFAKPTGSSAPDPAPVTFVAGDATLSLSPAAGSAASGGQIVYTGSLAVGGTPLPGRAVALGYTRGTESAPGGTADAGLVGTGNPLAGAATTSPNGTFTVTVGDAVEAASSTETGQVNASVAGAAESASATATFTPTPVRLKVRLTGAHNGRKADVLRIDAPGTTVGEQFQLFRKSKGKWERVLTKRLGKNGDAKVTVRDRNRGKATLYRVTVLPSPAVQQSTSNVRSVK